MGKFGALGFWLFLAVIVAGSITLAVGMIKLADRTLSDSVGQNDNSALSPFLTMCRPGFRRFARIHRRGRLGTVLLR